MSSYACRICHSPDYDLVLDYGSVVPADAFLLSSKAIENEQRLPLTLVICKECRHLQTREVLDPAMLFSVFGVRVGNRYPCVYSTLLSRVR